MPENTPIIDDEQDLDQPTAEKPLPEKEEPVDEKETKDVVPRTDYERVLIEAQSAKEKAALLDELLSDPEFQEYLKLGKSVPDAAATKTGEPTLLDLITETVEKAVKPLKEEITKAQEVYQSDKQSEFKKEIDKQIEGMEKDTVNYPLFKNVRVEMANLLQSGRALNLEDAYKLSTWDKAEAHGREKVVNKRRAAIGGGGVDERPGSTKERAALLGQPRSLRQAISDAFDKAGIVAGPDDHDD